MDQFTGGCLCGNVRIVASGLPYRVGLCHCFDCRKHHGALFHASAVFPQDAVTIDGETRDYAGLLARTSINTASADKRQVQVVPMRIVAFVGNHDSYQTVFMDGREVYTPASLRADRGGPAMTNSL